VLPYSEAQVVHNRTKSFSNYVFEPRISYISDLRRARDVMQRVGEELRGDPRFAHMILEPLEIVGVDAFTDVGVVLKARFKTQPGQQWRVGREFNLRIKTAFDAAQIEIGYPQVQADRSPASDDAAEASVDAPEPARQN
jgi:small-conductance mechanosensitive channel